MSEALLSLNTPLIQTCNILVSQRDNEVGNGLANLEPSKDVVASASLVNPFAAKGFSTRGSMDTLTDILVRGVLWFENMVTKTNESRISLNN